MAEQMQPSSKQDAPDPSFNYERSHPERESQGRMAAPNTVKPETGDRSLKAVTNRQNPSNNLVSDAGAHGKQHAADRGKPTKELPVPGSVAAQQPDHSMKDEEPLGSDLAPQNIQNPEHKRHPRTGGKGGTPDVGEATNQG